jgi:hypothetical protein
MLHLIFRWHSAVRPRPSQSLPLGLRGKFKPKPRKESKEKFSNIEKSEVRDFFISNGL